MNIKELKPYFRMSDYRACVNVTQALLTAEEQEVNYTLECEDFYNRVLHIWLTNKPNGPMVNLHFPTYESEYDYYTICDVNGDYKVSDTFYIDKEYSDRIDRALNILQGYENYGVDYECEVVSYDALTEKLVFTCSAEKYGDILDYLEDL